MDYHELKGMTVAQLRQVAETIQDLTGYTQMRKHELLRTICEHLNIEMHEHHEVVGIDKTTIKGRIRELKRRRDAALESRDRDELVRVRRQIHHLKRKIRRAMV